MDMNPSPQATVVPPVPSPRRGTRKLIGLIVVAVVLAGGYLAWAQISGSWPFTQREPSADEPGNDWRTYESTFYGFTIGYPASGTVIGTLETGDSAVIVVERGTSANALNSVSLSIVPLGQTRASGGAQWLQTTIDGRTAYRTATTTASGDTVIVYVVEVGRGKEMIISLPGLPSPSLFDEIFDSLTFTGQLFSVAQYRFTFQYPLYWYVRQDVRVGVRVENDAKPVWTGLEAPSKPEDWSSGTSVLIRQQPAKSLQEFVANQTIADETYVASAYPGLLVRQGSVPGTSGQEQYLAWQNGYGVSVTLFSSLNVPADRTALLRILSTFSFIK